MKTEDVMQPEESLAIISEMVERTKSNLRLNSFHFLYWGWVISILHFTTYVLLAYTDVTHPFYIWLSTLVLWIIPIVYERNRHKAKPSRTYIQKANGRLWLGYGIILFTFIFFQHKINFEINAVIMLMTAFATFVSGSMFRYKPIIYGSIAFFVAGIACFLVPTLYEFLICGAAIILGYLIPGYLLKRR